MFSEISQEIHIASFERDYFKAIKVSHHFTNLGKIESGKYLSRLYVNIKAIFTIRKLAKNYDIIYAFGLDLGIIGYFANFFLQKKLILEIADIRNKQTEKSISASVLRYLEKKLLKDISLLVLTSDNYFTYYYADISPLNLDLLVLENKVSQNLIDQNISQSIIEKNPTRIRIGYFGLLRCEWSWNFLLNLASRYPEKIDILIAGYSLNVSNIPDELKSYDNVYYFGEYISEFDSSTLYNNIDISWALYPIPSKIEKNWKWARTNRFYESCYFNTPMIGLKSSGDSDNIEKYNVGLLIDPNEKDLSEKIANIDHDNINEWVKNIKQLNPDVYMNNNEKNILSEKIKNMMN